MKLQFFYIGCWIIVQGDINSVSKCFVIAMHAPLGNIE